MTLEFSQYAFIVVLLAATPVAFYSGARFVALVLWLNLIFTLQYSHAPGTLMLVDVLSACSIVLVVRDRAALTVAAAFCFMVFAYRLVEPLGYYTTYTIVEGLAYVQIFAMGSAGFGTGIRIIRRRVRRIFGSSVHSQKSPMDTQANVDVALGKNMGPRVNAR